MMKKNKLSLFRFKHRIAFLNTLLFVSLILLLYNYQYTNYFIILFLPVFALYLCLIFLKKYSKRKTNHIRTLAYLVSIVFIVPASLILIFEPVSNLYIHLERSLFSFVYDGSIHKSAWPACFLSFILSNVIYKITKNPFMFIIFFVVLISMYVLFVYFSSPQLGVGC